MDHASRGPVRAYAKGVNHVAERQVVIEPVRASRDQKVRVSVTTVWHLTASASQFLLSSFIVLPRVWRVLGPLESVTGVLMCAISVSALFAILIHLLESETQSSSEIRMGPPSLADQPLDADSVNDMG